MRPSEQDPEPRDISKDDTQRQPRELISRTPDKAEGDEDTVEMALENQDEKKRR